MHTILPNIRTLSLQDLEGVIHQLNEPKYRAQQIYDWLWKKNIQQYDEMTNLSKSIREKLAEQYSFPALKIDLFQESADGTIKTKFKTFDNHFIEGVLIPTEERKTACVSSQIGCSLTCSFCATGKMSRKRNLNFDEIVDQVAFIQKQSILKTGKHLTNIVFMGMGEPLLNYQQVLKAIDKITHPTGMGMSARRITVSTAGVAKQIKQLGDDQVRFKLALSLHAANDHKRSQIMPINDSNNIKTLIESLNYFYAKTNNEITFEYILLNNFNDSEKDALELVKVYRQVPVDLVNIIEYNPIEYGTFKKPDEQGFERFIEILNKNKVNVRVRKSRGKDIDAACGQLANIKS